MSIPTLVIVALVAFIVAVVVERHLRRRAQYSEAEQLCREQRRKQRALNAVNELVGR